MNSAISDAEFDEALLLIVEEETGADERIFSIPGIYEILAEHFNNDAIDLARRIRKLPSHQQGKVRFPALSETTTS